MAKAPDHKDFVDVWAPWRTIERELKSGAIRTKTIVDFKIPTLTVYTGARGYNAIFANALRDLIQRQIRESSEIVKPSTQERRERYARDRESKSYKKRYAGGRTGETPPAPLTSNVPYQYAVDSGRFVNGIVMRLRNRSTGESVATMNVTNNRLRPELMGSREALARFRDRLRHIAPALNGNFTDKQARELKNAVKLLNEIAVATSNADIAKLRREQTRAFAKLARAVIRIVY